MRKFLECVVRVCEGDTSHDDLEAIKRDAKAMLGYCDLFLELPTNETVQEMIDDVIFDGSDHMSRERIEEVAEELGMAPEVIEQYVRETTDIVIDECVTA